MKPVYLDYAATTPVDVDVAATMGRYLSIEGEFGNPASRTHGYGWQAEAAVELARGQIAGLVGCDPREIIWTSGATEANNLALKGVVEAAARKCHLVTSLSEHKAVLDTCRWLESQGHDLTWLRPDAGGRVHPDQVAAVLRPDTAIVSVMLVNNETGVMNDLQGIGERCRSAKVLFHSDAAQAFGKVAIDLSQLPVDLMSFSAHKIYGPKGIGALYIRRSPDVCVAPQMHGGGHERGYRSGTLPTHQIAGFGHAAEIAGSRLEAELGRLAGLRAALTGALGDLPGFLVQGDPAAAFPGIVSLSFAGVEGEALLLGLRGLALSSGSACASASVKPSHVLDAMGVSPEIALSTIRLSMGRYTTEADISHAAGEIRRVVIGLRERSGR